MSSVSQQNPIKIFVSHVFETNDDYLRIFDYLESSHNFYYRNCSATEPHPGHTTEALQQELRKQIALAEVVIVPAAMYKNYRELIDFQVNCAKGLDKPIVVLETFGAKEKLPVQLEALADEVVEWNDREIADAIKRQARHEETNRWDVIEFKLD